MPGRTGPRQQVLTHLRSKNPKSGLQAPNVSAASATLQLHSTSKPALDDLSSYTISVKQKIQYTPEKGVTQDAPTNNLSLTKKIQVAGTRTQLDSSLIHSVYPPPGHGDFWTTLPHVLFSDPSVPWMFPSPDSLDNQSLYGEQPWFALFVFTQQELALSPDALASLTAVVKPLDQATPVAPSPTMTVSMPAKTFASKAAGQLRLGEGLAFEASTIEVAFIDDALYNGMFKPSNIKGRPFNMSHVRTVNTTGMTGQDGTEAGTFAVTVSQRPGPMKLQVPTTVHAHLVMLPRQDDGGTWPLPGSDFALKSVFQGLGNNIQPLRTSDAVSNAADVLPWIKNRVQSGYVLARHRPITGEVTACVFRGMLIPNNPFDSDMKTKVMQSSDFGTDLAIVDSDAGILNLTFQLAWTLGRSLAMSDKTFSAAVMRVRGSIHQQTLNAIKLDLDAASASSSYKGIEQVLKSMSTSSNTDLKEYSANTSSSNFHQRWKKPETLPSTKTLYSFTHQNVKEAYKQKLIKAAMELSAAASPDPHKTNEAHADETYPAALTDWATVFAWCLDKWFLSSSIPMEYLVPDPSSIPKESIRTFYIDPTWLRCLIDGALSVGEYTTDDDALRDNIKDAFERYLTTNIRGCDYPPQMPRFGIFIRSQLVKTYPNLVVSAPMVDNPLGKAEILRTQTLDQDLIVALFDRIHFEFGNGGWTFDGQEAQVMHNFRPVATADNPSGTVKPSNAAVTYTNASKEGFDFDFTCLIPQQITAQAQDALKIGQSSIDNASLLGSQLVASAPQLIISDFNAGYQDPQTMAGNSLKSSGRANYTVIPRLPDQPIVRAAAPPPSGKSPLPLRAKQTVSNLLVLLANTVVTTRSDADSFIGNAEQQVTINSGPPQWTTSLMKCIVYNLRTNCIPTATNQPQTLYNLIKPTVPKNSTDLHISLTASPKNRDDLLRIATKFEVRLGVGSQNLLAPFDSYDPKSGSSQLVYKLPSDPYDDYPHKPKFSGVKLPAVRFIGRGGRYRLTSTLVNNGTEFVVALTPLWDSNDFTEGHWMSNNQDASFVIEDVAVNVQNTINGQVSRYPVIVNEFYSGWSPGIGEDGSIGQAQGTVQVGVTARNP
ncbi:MAG: hypothetical protein Q9220_007664 [cf. Caloplaca sp. 1 TL-2023]